MEPRAPALPSGSLVGIDPLLRVPVQRAELNVPFELARDALERQPDMESSTLRSWGHLSRAAVTQLLTLAEPPSEADAVAEELTVLLADETLQWSLYYEGRTHGE